MKQRTTENQQMRGVSWATRSTAFPRQYALKVLPEAFTPRHVHSLSPIDITTIIDADGARPTARAYLLHGTSLGEG